MVPLIKSPKSRGFIHPPCALLGAMQKDLMSVLHAWHLPLSFFRIIVYLYPFFRFIAFIFFTSAASHVFFVSALVLNFAGTRFGFIVMAFSY